MNININFKNYRKTVCVLGLGFVGSAMAIAIASAEMNNKKIYNVIGIDLPTERGKKIVDDLNSGKFPFKSNDIDLKNAIENIYESRNFIATTDSNQISKADVIVIDINLDILYDSNDNPYMNLDNFSQSMRLVGAKIKENALVIVETTVPPGTCEKIVKPIITEEFLKRGIVNRPLISHSYERVMPGKNYFKSITNYWRVYSGVDEKSAKMCEAFLKTVIKTEEYPMTRLNTTTSSETAKVLENSYRAMNIAFMEEWGRFAENIGIDLYEIINAIRLRPTHSNMMQPGFGVGGYCLTKDPFFAKLASEQIFNIPDTSFPFSFEAVKTNNKMPLVSLYKIEKELVDLDKKKILLLGISYREDVGDTRFSPSEIFAKEAIKKGAILYYNDPYVKYWQEMKVKVSQSIYKNEVFDVIVFAVKHSEYKKISFKDWSSINKNTLIFDANNVLSFEQIQFIKNNGYKFISIGRG